MLSYEVPSFRLWEDGRALRSNGPDTLNQELSNHRRGAGAVWLNPLHFPPHRPKEKAKIKLLKQKQVTFLHCRLQKIGTHIQHSPWLRGLAWLQNATMSAENKLLLQIHFQADDKSLNKDKITICSHLCQVDWKPAFPQQVVQNPLWQRSQPPPHLLLGCQCEGEEWGRKRERSIRPCFNPYLHVCEDAGDFAGPGSCFLVARRGLLLSPWKSSRLGWKTKDTGSQLKGNSSKTCAPVSVPGEGRTCTH